MILATRVILIAIQWVFGVAVALSMPGTARAADGYDQDIVIQDGPIVYGTGLSDKDRHEAWKRFFMFLFEANVRQNAPLQGGLANMQNPLLVRCEKGQCFRMISAKLVGIGGSASPRRVVLIIVVDQKDNNIQLSRTVCTYPSEDGGIQFCRDWDTGKLTGIDMRNAATGEWEELK